MSATAQITQLSPEEIQLVLANRGKKEEEAKRVPYAKYRLLVGMHVEGLDGKTYQKGDIFWSCTNLSKRLGEDKFRFISLAEGVAPQDEEADPEDYDEEYEPEDTLAGMTIEELQNHAAEQGINLGRVKTRDKILSICRRHDADRVLAMDE